MLNFSKTYAYAGAVALCALLLAHPVAQAAPTDAAPSPTSGDKSPLKVRSLAAATLRARRLGRLGRLREALLAFAALPRSSLSPGARFDYGLVSYRVADFKRALELFQSVPTDCPQASLAQYYGGVSALKIGRFDVATWMLEHTCDLPPELKKRRDFYLAWLLQPKSPQLIAYVPAKPAAAPVATKPPAAYQGFRSLQKQATLLYTSDTENDYNHSYSTGASTNKTSSLKVASGVFKPSAAGDGALGLQLSLGAKDSIATGKQITYVDDPAGGHVTRQLEQPVAGSEVRSGQASADAWMESRIVEDLWVSCGGKVDVTAPEFQGANRSGKRAGYLELDRHAAFGDLSATYTYTQVTDHTNQANVVINAANLSVERTLASKLVLDGRVEYDGYQYTGIGMPLDGPVVQQVVEAAMAQPMPWASSLSLTVNYQSQQHYTYYHIGDAPMVADGATYNGKLALESHPFGIFIFKVSESLSHSQWALQDESARQVFEQNVPSDVEVLSFSLGLRVDL